jgi:hypothetical protein
VLPLILRLSQVDTDAAGTTAPHRHHSSVSRRLEALTSGWGLDLERPQDRMRAETAFLLYTIFGDGR